MSRDVKELENEAQNLANKTAETLNKFNPEETFKLDLENRFMAMIVEILKEDGPAIAISKRTLDKYTEEDAIREMKVSNEDLKLLDDKLKFKLFIVYVFNKVVKNRVISFNEVKVMQINSEYLKDKVIESKDDFENLRVVFKLLEKRTV